MSIIARRLLGAVVVLALVSMVTFAVFFLVPRLAGQNAYELATQYVGKNPSPATVRAVELKLGLNEPVWRQYLTFVSAIVLGAHYDVGPSNVFCHAPCFGYSFRTGQPVWPQLVSDLPVTVSLSCGAAILWLGGGVAVGVGSALRRGRLFDRVAMAGALAGVSLPVFFTGLIALDLFSYKWQLFPDVHYVGITDNPLLWAKNLVLPWLVLAFVSSALYARLTRAGMLETMGADFIRTARAKGLPERTVIVKHGLRAALTPIVTIFGMDLGLLLGGAVVVEYTFSLPGLGLFTIKAINNEDLPEIMGVVLLAALFIVVANLIVDIAYLLLDPRVRL